MNYSAGCKGRAARFATPMRKRRSVNEIKPPRNMIVAPTQIQLASG